MPIEDLSAYMERVKSSLEAIYQQSLKALDEAKENVLKEAESRFNEEANKPRGVARKL